MKTLKLDLLKYRAKNLASYVVEESLSIKTWNTRTGLYLGPENYTYDSDEWTTIDLGDYYYSYPDATRWFKTTITVPNSFRGQKVFLKIDFGGEISCKINGKTVCGFSSSMAGGWTHRDEILVLENAEGGEVLNIEMEGGLNYGGFADNMLAGEDRVEYKIATSELNAINDDAQGYYFDLTCALEALDVIDDKEIYAKVYLAIDDSIDCIDYDFTEERLKASLPIARTKLKDRLSKIKHAPMGHVMMTGHSHIDTAWLWPVKETVRKCERTFSNVLALTDEYKEMIFAQSQAQVYDFTKRYYPQLYARIKDAVKKGQWDIVGSSWVECDTNVPTGESLVRQLLYGRDFFIKEFGQSSDIYWLPDCFGFSWALPQIIKKSGMKYFMTAKLSSNEYNQFPHNLFKWQGADGSQICAYNQRVPYNGEYQAEYVKNAWNTFSQKDECDYSMAMFGYGDGGGGPTYAMVERSKRFANFPGLPSSKIEHASEFFNKVGEVSDTLPVWNDECYFERHRGTYTTHANNKANNRRGEFLYRNLEMASTYAALLTNNEYPKSKIEEGYKTLLANQFHDILPGTSIEEVFRVCDMEYAQLLNSGNEVYYDALDTITKSITSKGKGYVVYSFLPQASSQDVKIPAIAKDSMIVNSDMKSVSFITQDDFTTFNACVGAMGYETFYVVKGTKESNKPVIATKNILENNNLKVTLNDNGLITSINDKINDKECIKEDAYGNLMQIFQDKPYHESAWDIELQYQKKFWNLEEFESIEVIEQNHMRGVIKIVRKFNKSTFTQCIVLKKDALRVDFVNDVDWHETDKMLKASFIVNINSTKATYEMAYGAIERPTHWNTSYDIAKFEACGHKWADLSESDYGVSLINDCKYGYDIKDDNMRITLLRSPKVPDRNADMGNHKFTYSFFPHAGRWDSGDTVAQGFDANIDFVAIPTKKNEGSLPEKSNFITINKKGVIIDCIKKAQDDNGYIIRVYNSIASRGQFTINSIFNFVKVCQCNLMEDYIADIDITDNSFDGKIKPFEVNTYRVWF